MTDQVFKCRGIDEKYLHEASARTRDSVDGFIMAGDAIEQQQHAQHAIRCIADLNRFHREFWNYERSISHGR